VLSLYAAPAVRDLLLEVDPGTEVRVVGVRRPEFLCGIALTPGLEGLELRQDRGQTVVRVETDAADAAARVDEVRSALRHAQQVGLPADPDLWFGLYVRSNDALSEDTALSRAHAGYRDVDATGRIVKQMDDDNRPGACPPEPSGIMTSPVHHPDDVDAQCDLVLRNTRRALEAVGSSMSRIAHLTIYLTDIADRPAFNNASETQVPKRVSRAGSRRRRRFGTAGDEGGSHRDHRR
jgi:hypothetical protein